MTIEYYSEGEMANQGFDVARNDFKLRFKDRKAVDAVNRLRMTRKFTGCVYLKDRYTAVVSGLLPQQIDPVVAEKYFERRKAENTPRVKDQPKILADQNVDVVRKLASTLGGTLLMPRRTR